MQSPQHWISENLALEYSSPCKQIKDGNLAVPILDSGLPQTFSTFTNVS